MDLRLELRRTSNLVVASPKGDLAESNSPSALNRVVRVGIMSSC
jgi:hypothetical protein